MSIGKLALVAMTLFGLAIGVHEGVRLAGGLVVIIIAQILLFGAAMTMLVRIARDDRAQQDGAGEEPEAPPASSPRDSISTGSTAS